MTDPNSHYARSGVNIDAGQRAVQLMKDALTATYTPEVLSNTGNFGGLYDASKLKQLDAPVIVASTDGVGTKTKVAARMNLWDTIGQDLVNHCINDILVQGARPLFFMDYVASDKLLPEQIAAIVTGMANACQQAGCALLGGETAEMPGVYVSGEVDVVGTIVGVVDRDDLLDGSTIKAGDVILNLPSSGLHTNGYSLARAVLDQFDWTETHPELGAPIGEILLAVHRCYLQPIHTLQSAGVTINGLAHITGGGVIDNLPRILPDGMGADINIGAWDIPPIFDFIQRTGDISTAEMYRVFNMGLGMLVVVSPDNVERALSLLDDACRVGEVIAGSGVTLKGAE